jgi:N-glycosylase/DNA lyase
MDKPGTIPVDTHVFQIAQRFGFVKSGKTQANLNQKLYHEIGDAFRNVHGDKAGWAH